MAHLAPTEIQALARIVNELDYYQLIQVARGESPRCTRLLPDDTAERRMNLDLHAARLEIVDVVRPLMRHPDPVEAVPFRQLAQQRERVDADARGCRDERAEVDADAGAA